MEAVLRQQELLDYGFYQNREIPQFCLGSKHMQKEVSGQQRRSKIGRSQKHFLPKAEGNII